MAGTSGGILVWIIVFLELVTFGAGLGVFLFQAKTLPSEFTLGRDLLNQRLALINTMVLLTGGWCMANCLGFLRINRPQQALFWIRCAIVTGLGFSGDQSRRVRGEDQPRRRIWAR